MIGDNQILIKAMATCHSLSYLEENNDKKLIGDPLDVEMFSYAEKLYNIEL